MTDKRYFIEQEHVGLEAYTNAYVHGLEARIERMDSERIGRVAELHATINRLRAELRRLGIIRGGSVTRCLVCGASADLGDAIEHTTECLLHAKGS